VRIIVRSVLYPGKYNSATTWTTTLVPISSHRNLEVREGRTYDLHLSIVSLADWGLQDKWYSLCICSVPRPLKYFFFSQGGDGGGDDGGNDVSSNDMAQETPQLQLYKGLFAARHTPLPQHLDKCSFVVHNSVRQNVTKQRMVCTW